DSGKFNHYRTGNPFFSVDGDRTAKKDLRTLVPTVVLVVIGVLFLTFRTIKGTLIPLIGVLVSVIWAMGLVAVSGQALTTVGIAIPVILVSVGSAYGIHVMNEYYRTVKSEDTKADDLVEAMTSVGVPLMLSCLTTMAGFISLAATDLLPIKQFGLYTVFGVMAAFVTAFSLVPAMLAVVPFKQDTARKRANSDVFAKIGSRVFNKSAAVVLAVVLLALLAISQFPKLAFDTDLAGFFKPDHPTRIAMDMVNTNFGGASPLQVHITGDLQNPYVLKQMQVISGHLESAGANNPVSYATLIQEANKAINGPERIPTTRNQVTSLGLFLEGQDQLKDYVTGDYKQGLIISRLTETKSTKMSKINDKIRASLDDMPKTYYAVNRELAEGKLGDLAQTMLFDGLAAEAAHMLWENPTANNIKALREELQMLAGYDWTLFAQVHGSEMEHLVRDYLDPDRLWFELEDGLASFAAARDGLQEGQTPEVMAESLAEINPGTDMFDLEDLAYDLWDESRWLYQMTRDEIVNHKALTLAELGEKPIELEALSGILKDVWAGEVYTSDLPGEFRQNPAVEAHKFAVELTGSPVIYEVTTTRLQTSQRQSLLISLGLVALLLILQLRSWKMGIIACLPIGITVLINFGTMAVSGISLDVATTMIASIAVGTGVDYSIHFANRLRRARAEHDTLEEALKQTLSQVGRAITANAVSVALGFSVLLLSSTVTIAHFGGLTALTMLVSAALALVFLPAIYVLVENLSGKRKSKSKEGAF
ncbi:MAG: MMPL family transporter, partial [Firmicutes bacterium]|nr:MMPL family transporter [Bacillota bacterium]